LFQRDEDNMSESVLTSPARPKLFVPGQSSLLPGVERYVLKGGGTAVYELDKGDRVEISPLEGGQSVEIVAFAPGGKSDLGAIGLSGKGKPTGIQKALEADSEDAQRVRFGLFRRGLDLGRVKAATVLGRDSVPGDVVALQAEKSVLVVLGAPAEPMIVWEQTPATDVLVFIQRANPKLLNEAKLPDPIAEPRLDIRINIASAESFEVYSGEYIQIIDVAGRQCSDFLAFNRKELDKGNVLGLDSTTTRSMTGMSYPKPGLFSKFFDRDRNPLVEVVQDTVGRHDTFNLACTTRYYEDMGYFGHPNCSDNFNDALKDYPVGNYRGWPAINFFFNTNVDCHNNIWSDEPWSRPGDYVMMRALTDLVCGTSACPADIDASNGWNLTEIHVRVYPKDTPFKRSIGYRMAPDAPMQLTRESGFHPRTSALTRNFGDYRGFWVPHCYANAGAIEEYWACRERAVIMDLSPLRKMEVLGPDAEQFLNGIITRDVRKLSVGQIYYTPMCYEHGGMVDDGTLFRLGENNFRWIGGDDASLIWLKEQLAKTNYKVTLKTATSELNNVAVQGPKTREILATIIETPPGRPTMQELGVFRFTIGRIGGVAGIPVLVSRTGYTGELGYEVFCHPKDGPAVWDAIMTAGAPFKIQPFGFDALDMVRIEAGLVFGGHDFDSTTDPLEAGISFTVPSKKEEDYIGKAAIENRRAHPLRKLIGLEIEGNEKPSHGDPVYVGRAQIGIVTSAMRSPLLKKTLAFARVEAVHSEIGTALEIGRLDGMQKRLKATVVPFPFYDPKKERVRM
jgi:aminomethyltransferase